MLSFGDIKATLAGTASSLASGLRNLSIQSELVLKSAKDTEKDFLTEDGQNMLLLCRKISELSQLILTHTGTQSNSTAHVSATNLVICDTPDDQILATHSYAIGAKSLTFSPPGRFKRLITEITTLKTGLPPGIFVRYCENRPDVLKVAIIGPGGTPYENGIFEFDFFCNSKYPHKPPMVHFKGTGGGRISINPNLYHCGKVCLSLLGTWSGERWKPGGSTLLQVVVSLQAMIFCEEPWYNEPGREAGYNRGSGSSHSAMYNSKLREHTVNHAMLVWLERPPPLWKDVVDHHFEKNANAILRTVEGWAHNPCRELTGARRYDGFHGFDSHMLGIGSALGASSLDADMASMFPRLQTALQKYGATYVMKTLRRRRLFHKKWHQVLYYPCR